MLWEAGRTARVDELDSSEAVRLGELGTSGVVRVGELAPSEATTCAEASMPVTSMLGVVGETAGVDELDSSEAVYNGELSTPGAARVGELAPSEATACAGASMHGAAGEASRGGGISPADAWHSSESRGSSLVWTGPRGIQDVVVPPGAAATAAGPSIGGERRRRCRLRRPLPSSAGGGGGESPAVEGWLKGITEI